MGYDPFWPTSLAVVNVLCVPAAAISSQRFTEIFNLLKTVQEVKIADLGLDGGFYNDLIGTSKYKEGSILYDFGTSIRQSNLDRFPLEPNAVPQVVLGVYENAFAASSSRIHEETQVAQQEALNLVFSELEAAFGSSQNGRICRLLAFNVTPEGLPETILCVPKLEQDVLVHVMRAVSRSLILSVCQLTRVLPDIEFRNPRNSTSSFQKQSDRRTNEQEGGPDQDTMRDGESRSQAVVASPMVSLSASSADEISANFNQPEEHHKSRYTIVVGLLNMYIGSWPDAMRRLDEGASLAREAGDSLWQARALESLLICMALFAWKGENFDVPEVCLKAHSTVQMLSRSSTFLNQPGLNNSFENSATSELSPDRKWGKYAAVVAQATLNVYSSLVSDPVTKVPVTVLTESRIRVGNLLLFTQSQVDGVDTRAFKSLILDRTLRSLPHELSKRSSMSTDPSLVSMMLDALSTPVNESSEFHIFSALSAVISSLSQLRASRRHAFLFRGLLQKLIPILIRARKFGASEAGVHPASAMSSTTEDVQDESQTLQGDFKSLLDAAAAAYDIHLPRKEGFETVSSSSAEQIRENLQAWYLNQATGDISLKLEMLQLCVHASDAFPDPNASLDFSSSVLRCGLRSMTISMTSINTRPALLPEEQARLVEGIKRTVSTGQRLGFDNLRANYWDDFLVRGIEIYQPPDAARLTSHKPSELSLIDDGTKDNTRDPFIFNPFAKAHSAETSPVIVAGELVTFSVILQNPLEIEIDVNDIFLLVEGCDFVPTHHSIVLGPFWSQAFSLTGTPQESGRIKIVGCRATIAGCRQKDFPIFVEDWQARLRIKQKANFRAKVDLNEDGEGQSPWDELRIPESKTLFVKVIDPQPHLTIKSSSLPQPSLMLLEGEKKTFALKINNESPKIPTDFLLFTYDDNVTSGLQEALGKKDLLPIDTYEIQYQLKHRPTIVMAPEDGAKVPSEDANRENASYEFDLFGRPGLINAAVQMNFAYLGVPRSEVKQTFHTRQKRFPLAVTVNGSIDIPRCNILPISGEFPWIAKKNADKNDVNGQATDHSNIGGKYCMLSLDLRNVWPHTLSVGLISKLRLEQDAIADDDDKEQSTYTMHEDLQPGHVTRIILLVPRLFIQDPYAPIPNLITQRQFVVSAPKLSHEAEAASREMFWYREELLKHLSGTWKEDKTGRHGDIDLRKAIRLNPRMIEVLKIDHVDISFSISPGRKSAEDDSGVKVVGKSHFSVLTEAFATLRARVHNRSKDRLALLLRLQPSLRDQPHNIALDLSRRFAWSGVLQQALHPALEPGDTREAQLDIMVFAEGQYEVNATVEEIKGRTKSSVPSGVDAVGVTSERRIWHARSPCFIDAFDAPS